MVENVANLMTINLIEFPLNKWGTSFSVKRWLRKNHSSDDSMVKKKEKKKGKRVSIANWLYNKLVNLLAFLSLTFTPPPFQRRKTAKFRLKNCQ